MGIKGIQIDDEIEDELFCESLAERYLNDSEHEVILFEDAIKEAGYGYSDAEMDYFKEFVRNNAHLIIEFSQEGDILNASNF